MNVVSVADTQTDLFEEPLFDEATSSKTDKSQTVFTETSMEATPFVDVSSLSCQDCKVKTSRLKNLNRRVNRQNLKIIKQKRKLTSQKNVSSLSIIIFADMPNFNSISFPYKYIFVTYSHLRFVCRQLII